ncbi:CHAT domain-containing protein [Nostoc sp. FACHB-190]|uniref:CHAT domain-containing protein n=1 Tax=Nostoc sp. FACHB-190 TaxID=2692838 RepID=UPI001687351B|nr:CHAT domain-containing protein [Nostoc sp. FACHB-190]MBD2301800.1 CHAT domain-containing protein [Nostoc sp. FACHB-190]
MSSGKDIEYELIVESYDIVRFRNRKTDAQSSGHLNLAPICRKIARFENLLRAKQLKSREAFEEFGKLLYQCLFNGAVDNAFRELLKEIRESKRTGNNKWYRLQLTFRQEVDDLASIPWEFLYYPDTHTTNGFFLVDEPYLAISRYIPSDSGRDTLNVRGELLKFLVVASQPEEEGMGKVLPNRIIEVINNLKNNYLIDLTILENPKRQELQETIDNTKPHILHYIGHGRFDSQKQVGEIALVNSAKKADWVSDRTFGDFFRDFQPRLVILQACQGGEVDFTANYAGLAPQLTRREIPAVIAMQYPICNAVASFFSESFYLALAKGESVDTAMQQSRMKIVRNHPWNPEFYTNRDFGTPVLYMSARNGYIMPRPKAIKFDAEVLRNSPDELEKAINILFNSEELANIVFGLRLSYKDINGETQQEKVKSLIDQLIKENDIESLVEEIKECQPESFTDYR